MVFDPILQIEYIFIFSIFFILSIKICYYFKVKHLYLRVITFLAFIVFILNPQINKKYANYHKDIVIVVSDMTQSIIETGKATEVKSIHKNLSSQLNEIGNIEQISSVEIHTSHHTHYVIGTGANDPQKMDPNASRETLDHSIMYIFTVALEDGNWHHIKSYTPERAHRKSTIEMWNKVKTFEDPIWTKKYHDPNPKNKSFGAKVIITLNNGKVITEQLDRADAHPYGARPFKRQNYINKFLTLTEGILDKKESNSFLKNVQNLKNLKSGQLHKLNLEVKKNKLKRNLRKGIF